MAGADALKERISTVPDFPIPGIQFKDISPLLADGDALAQAVAGLAADLEGLDFDAVLAVESRGFVVGAPLAARFGRGFIMVRKPRKLPGETDSFPYSCEYCTGELEISKGLVREGGRYLVVDDLLATGGTARAIADFVLGKGGTVAGYCFLVELTFLAGADQLCDAPVVSLLRY
jgi:adenine phosphoribosyltransferase